MTGKGDKRRPGDGYDEGWDRIWGRGTVLHLYVECPHCGFVDNEPDLSASCTQGWICRACELTSMVETGKHGEVLNVTLGYKREVQVDYD